MSLCLPCPNCGAEVVFRSPALPARVCDHCHTMLVRSDDGIAAVGMAAALPFDVSPVQIGMRGTFEGKPFQVIGRVRWGWTDGAWNEWLLLFGDGEAWLGEAMGQFMLQRERSPGLVRAEVIKDVAAGGTAIPGAEAQIGGIEMSVSDAREVVCLAAEGELPFTPTPGWTVYSVDLRGPDGECATIQRDDAGANFYEGRYVTLAELAPTGLRAIEGWTLPSYA